MSRLYPSCTHLAVAHSTGILQAIIKCYCLPSSLQVRLTFTFSLNSLPSNTKFCSLYSR